MTDLQLILLYLKTNLTRDILLILPLSAEAVRPH